jgi:hypothetical protein
LVQHLGVIIRIIRSSGMKILYVFNTLIIECSTFLLISPLLKLVFSIYLDFVYGQKGGEKEDTIGEALKANTFF